MDGGTLFPCQEDLVNLQVVEDFMIDFTSPIPHTRHFSEETEVGQAGRGNFFQGSYFPRSPLHQVTYRIWCYSQELSGPQHFANRSQETLFGEPLLPSI